MNEYYVQLIILAGAYACAGFLLIAASVTVAISWRSIRALEVKRSAMSRLTTLENDMRSHADLVDRLSKRWSKRTRDEAKKEPEDAPQSTITDRDDLVVAFNGKRRAAAHSNRSGE